MPRRRRQAPSTVEVLHRTLIPVPDETPDERFERELRAEVQAFLQRKRRLEGPPAGPRYINTNDRRRH